MRKTNKRRHSIPKRTRGGKRRTRGGKRRTRGIRRSRKKGGLYPFRKKVVQNPEEIFGTPEYRAAQAKRMAEDRQRLKELEKNKGWGWSTFGEAVAARAGPVTDLMPDDRMEAHESNIGVALPDRAHFWKQGGGRISMDED